MSDTKSITRTERVRQASRARRERAKEDLRKAILDAAGELFVERGYEGFSLRQVAERIGYSATTIYLYFEDKDDLLFHVIIEGFERFLRRLQAAAARHDDPRERLRALGRAYVDFGLGNPAYYQAMFVQRTDLLMRGRDTSAPAPDDSFLVLQHAVQAAIDAGALRPGDARTYSTVLWAVVHGIVSLALRMPRTMGARARELADVALDAAMDGLAPR